MPPPAPGRLIDVGGFRLHLRCLGAGGPAVILDAALGASSLSWALVQPQVAAFARACTYDRAGFGWSDAGPPPRTAGRLAQELERLLDRAPVPPPYVLVGHSYGALTMRLLAIRRKADVRALVLIDPAHAEEWIAPSETDRRRIDHGVWLCRRGALAARLGVARLVALLAALGAARAARALVALAAYRRARTRAATPGRGSPGSGGIDRLIAPVWRLPPELRRHVRWMWTQPKFFEALGGQIAAIGESAAEVAAAELPEVPLVVLAAGDSAPERLALHRALAARVPNGRVIVVEGSGHWIPLERPDAVIAAVRETVLTVAPDIEPSSASPDGPRSAAPAGP
jgi:pimeloyl-ACP methyl ester carboxylesterase